MAKSKRIDASFLCQDQLPPSTVIEVIARILWVKESDISMYDEDRHEVLQEGLSALSPASCQYLRIGGDFKLAVTVYLDPAIWNLTPLHFCRVFANLSNTVCAADTQDGNPYTWTLLAPGEPDVIVTVADDSFHNPELADADDYEPQYNILKRHGPPPLAWG